MLLLAVVLAAGAACCGALPTKVVGIADFRVPRDLEAQVYLSDNFNGSYISQSCFDPPPNASMWVSAGDGETVAAALQAAGQIPDLYKDGQINDVTDASFGDSWWYWACLDSPRIEDGSRVQLRFEGINYRASVWVNGTQVGFNTTVVGSFRYLTLDITEALDPTVVGGYARFGLAVLVERPNDVYWTRNATDLAMDFIDWVHDPPAQNMGIWRRAWLAVTPANPVAMSDAPIWVTTTLEGDWFFRAAIHVELQLQPTGPGGTIPSINLTDYNLDLDVGLWGTCQVNAGAVSGISHTPHDRIALTVTDVDGNCSILRMRRDSNETGAWPLWWPRNMQLAQHTWPVTVELATAADGSLVDTASATVGFREVSSTLDANQNRQFFVNGQQLLIRAGGWAPDLLQRWNSSELAMQLRLVASAGLNAIRFEGKLQSDDLYDRMDAAGLMAMPGWACCDAWQNWPLWGTEQHEVAQESTLDQMRRLRAHPSMLVFLLSSDELPPRDVEEAYLNKAAEAGWPVPTLPAAASVNSPFSGPSGVKMNGPYAWVPPNYWTDPKGLVDYGGAYGFSTEISPGAAPMVLESWLRTVSEDQIWPEGGASSDIWNTYCGNPHGLFGSLSNFLPSLDARYPDPTAAGPNAAALTPTQQARRFLMRSQAAALESHRAMFNGYVRRRAAAQPGGELPHEGPGVAPGAGATGVVQWMLNNAMPQHIWHLYDHYLTPGGSFFGAQKALRALSVQFDAFDGAVCISNGDFVAVAGPVNLTVELVDANGTHVGDGQLDASLADGLPADTVVCPLQLKKEAVAKAAEAAGGVAFVVITARSARTSVKDTFWVSAAEDRIDWSKCNFYKCPMNGYADFSALVTPSAPFSSAVQATITNVPAASLRSDGLYTRVATVLVTNLGDRVAPLVRLRLVDANGVDWPTAWSDNFMTLLPGEAVTVSGTAMASEVTRHSLDDISVVVETWGDVFQPASTR